MELPIDSSTDKFLHLRYCVELMDRCKELHLVSDNENDKKRWMAMARMVAFTAAHMLGVDMDVPADDDESADPIKHEPLVFSRVSGLYPNEGKLEEGDTVLLNMNANEWAVVTVRGGGNVALSFCYDDGFTIGLTDDLVWYKLPWQSNLPTIDK